jgi:negative regulator of sigma E activity
MKNELPNNFLPTDATLDDALKRLPDAHIASNFTARVMQAIELEEAKNLRVRRWHWRALFPRIAFASALILFTGIILRQHEFSMHRANLEKTVAQISTQPLPSIDALKNFDAIQRMSKPAVADNELLADLQ